MQKHSSLMFSVKRLTFMGVLVALQFVLTRFLGLPISSSKRISFAYLPIVFAAMTMGPLASALVNATADILGALLIPQGGAIDLRFTLTAAIAGLIYGTIIYDKSEKLSYVVIAHILVMIICQWILNNIWLSNIIGIPFIALWTSRFWLDLIKLPVDIVFLIAIVQFYKKIPKTLLLT